MPPIRQIAISKNTFTFEDRKGGLNRFDASGIPNGADTIAKVENYLNDTWLPPLLGGEYQMVVHVFGLSPLALTVCAADLGVKIEADWWMDEDDTGKKVDPGPAINAAYAADPKP